LLPIPAGLPTPAVSPTPAASPATAAVGRALVSGNGWAMDPPRRAILDRTLSASHQGGRPCNVEATPAGRRREDERRGGARAPAPRKRGRAARQPARRTLWW